MSLSNVDMVLDRIRGDVRKSTQDKRDEVMAGVYFLQAASLHQEQLAEMFGVVAELGPALKKPAQWHTMCECIYGAIWKWIENYTTEFVALWQDKMPFAGDDPSRLFELLDGWSKKKGQPSKIWPAQTMLLLLCPKIVVAVAQDKDSEQTRFFQKMKKAVRSSKSGPDFATACLIDVCRTSTYVSGPVALRYMSPAINEELIALLLNPKSTPREADEGMLTDLLVASFRLSPTKTTTQLLPQCLSVDASVTFQQVAVAALVVIAREGAFLPWTPTIQIAYSPLVQSVRQLFSTLLDGFVAYEEGLQTGDRRGKQVRVART